jgi:hypothetical protein
MRQRDARDAVEAGSSRAENRGTTYSEWVCKYNIAGCLGYRLAMMPIGYSRPTVFTLYPVELEPQRRSFAALEVFPIDLIPCWIKAHRAGSV